eukprot:g20161.t1
MFQDQKRGVFPVIVQSSPFRLLLRECPGASANALGRHWAPKTACGRRNATRYDRCSSLSRWLPRNTEVVFLLLIKRRSWCNLIRGFWASEMIS